MKDFYSKYFTVKELANGVFAAIENKDAATGSNAGIVDLGDYSIVFDSFLNIDAARDLKRASIELTGKEPQFVVISHFHLDHIVGNQIFGEDTRIISSSATREMMIKQNEEYEGERSQYDNEIKKIEEQLKSEKDETAILNLNNSLLFLRNMARPEIKLRMPDVTINDRMVMEGNRRSVEILVKGMAHSPGDIILYLPQDKICFMGDMLFKNSHPWLGSGDPDSFIEKLEEVLKLDVNHFVPGHGDVGDSDDVKLEIQYIKEVKELVERKVSEESPSFTINEISEAFRHWGGLCFLWNTDFMLKKMKASRQND